MNSPVRLFQIVLFLPPLFILTPKNLFADARREAQALERQGEIDRAIELYRFWIAENPAHPDVAEVVIHAASLYDDPLEVIAFLEHFGGSLRHSNRSRVYARVAGLQASLGLPAEAARNFGRAAETGGGDVHRWRLESLTLRFSLGNDVRSEALVMRNSENPLIAGDAAAVAALVLARNGKTGEAVSELKAFERRSPAYWLVLARLSAYSGDLESQREAISALENAYPGSANLYVAQARVLEWVSPSTLVTASQQPNRDPVQVGAFSSRSRAAAFRTELENHGFTAWMEQENELWKVVVHDPDGQVTSRLVSRGYQVSAGR